MTEQRSDDVEPTVRRQPQPQISGTRGGHSVSLHSLARRGVVLLGRLHAIHGRTLRLADDLLSNAAVGDASSAKLCAGIDAFVDKTGVQASPSTLDDADMPFEELAAFGSLRELEMSAIKTVIWATGFGCDYSYLDPAWLDDSGRPRHREGCCEVEGLYVVGMQWLRRRVSGLILGAANDAAFIVEQIERSASS